MPQLSPDLIAWALQSIHSVNDAPFVRLVTHKNEKYIRILKAIITVLTFVRLNTQVKWTA